MRPSDRAPYHSSSPGAESISDWCARHSPDRHSHPIRWWWVSVHTKNRNHNSASLQQALIHPHIHPTRHIRFIRVYRLACHGHITLNPNEHTTPPHPACPTDPESVQSTSHTYRTHHHAIRIVGALLLHRVLIMRLWPPLKLCWIRMHTPPHHHQRCGS